MDALKHGRPTRALRMGGDRHRWFHRLLAVALILSGALISGWPVGETLVEDRLDAAETTSYVTSVEGLPAEVLSKELKQAREYNANLPTNSLSDPWDGTPAAATAAHDRYLKTLDASRAMGRIRIPAIHVDLRIFHDADRLSMTYGVGHMYGSSLPVGGIDTHTVLAAHTGLSGRTRFDRLPELKLGDTFSISAAKQTLSYRVDQIDVVEPWDLESVQRVPGMDYATLVTCYTPPGSHKQRLLVRGVRVLSPAGSTGSTTSVTAEEPQVALDVVIQTWMWPRLLCVAVAIAALLGMAISWAMAGRRRHARSVPRLWPEENPSAVSSPQPRSEHS